MTGELLSPEERQEVWNSHRVFFLTPHILANDLNSESLQKHTRHLSPLLFVEICDPRSIVCMVVDEAHKALGDYPCCIAVRNIASATRHFRVLALSATPGGNTTNI